MGEKGNVLEGTGSGLAAGVGGADAGTSAPGVAGADAGPAGPVRIAGADASQAAAGPDLGAIAGAGGAAGSVGMVAAAKRRRARGQDAQEEDQPGEDTAAGQADQETTGEGPTGRA